MMILASLLFAATAAAAKLPLVDIPPTSGSSDTLVVFLSGDGGWARIDREIARVLAGNGMPVVGLNSLQYFWTRRTPEGAARDLQTILEGRLAQYHKTRAVLVGYSRGADVIPIMASRLPPELRAKIRLIALLGPSPRVELEMHVADWLRDSHRGIPVRPELEKLAGVKTLCIYGEDDRDSLCSGLSMPNLQVIMLRGGHHFEGDYPALAKLILEGLR